MVSAPPTLSVLVPSEKAKALAAPVMVAVLPAVSDPPVTLIDRRPDAPPTAPLSTLALPRESVPVLAPAVEVMAPISVVLGARLMTPSPAKFVAVMLIEPEAKLTVPPPDTSSVVA